MDDIEYPIQYTQECELAYCKGTIYAYPQKNTAFMYKQRSNKPINISTHDEEYD